MKAISIPHSPIEAPRPSVQRERSAPISIPHSPIEACVLGFIQSLPQQFQFHTVRLRPVTPTSEPSRYRYFNPTQSD